VVGEAARVDDVLRGVARDFGTPAYVYFVDQIRARVADVRAAFGNRFQLSFAVKCNPNHGLLRRLRGVVDLLDVSSGGEVRRALVAGWEATRVSFTGPGKTAAELRTALEAGVGEIVVESLDEAELLHRLAAAAGRRARVLLRIAPARVPRGFGLNMSGKPSQFGIDEEDLDAAVRVVTGLPQLELAGFHI
jgi:diaminopimelate decarboxylase